VSGDVLELTVDGPHGARTVRVSHPERVYFPDLGVVKADVVRYFLSVGEGVLAALRERPVTLERWPAGVHPGSKLSIWKGAQGEAFFQRRVPRGAPAWVETVRVPGPDGSIIDAVCPTEIAVVGWAANLGTLTFHPWPVRRAHLDRPDQMWIDLDPQRDTTFGDAVRVALELRELLADLGIDGVPKTSGGRGAHVLVSIQPRWSFADVHRALIALGRELVRRMPRQATMERLKRDRGARVYVDCTPQTIASAYSVRPTARAMVSAPVTWEELTVVDPKDFDVRTMPRRFAAVGDVHAELGDQRFGIEPLLEMADRHQRDGIGGEVR
jgi:DNA ligase D-like protein (predicted polymerase)